MMGTIKAERHEDAEINEMARKIAEQNRAKMLSTTAQQQQLNGMRPGLHGAPNTIQAYFAPTNAAGRPVTAAANLPPAAAVAPPQDHHLVDAESRRGRFGWCEFEKVHIPYIFRAASGTSPSEMYTSVRMVERKLLSKFLSQLPPEVNSCHCIRSYYITDAESKLLNEINAKHADCYYGKEPFTTKDLVVKMRDAKEFFRFLDLCYKKIVLKRSNASDRCGFFRINNESVVPYTVTKGVKVVPLFYFEGETDHLRHKSETVDGWDLAYLKFCCKVQGIRNELFAADVCRVVALDEIKGHFPPGTTFEDYWPAKGSIEPVSANQRLAAGTWTQKPATTVPSMPSSGVSSLSTVSSMSSASAAKTVPSAQSLYDSTTAAAALQYQQYQQQQQYLRNAAVLSQQLHHMQSLNYMTQASAAAAAQQSVGQAFPGRLTQIKEFQVEKSQQAAYKLQKALIEQKIVPCINVRPYVFNDLMMTFPDFVKNFCPDLSVERARHMLQDILKIVLYKGNRGHQTVLLQEGKCNQFDPVPLLLVKDIISYAPQLKYILSQQASYQNSKRLKLS